MIRLQLKHIGIAVCALCCTLSCGDIMHEPTEAELSAFGTYVYELDTAQLQCGLEQALADGTDTWVGDGAVRRHYADADSFELAPLWFTRMGVSDEADSLLAYLRRELPANGLDTTAFLVPQIAADLAVVQELSFDSLGIDINELLPRLDYNLSKAYMRYVVGMRYGFVRPDRLLNHLDYRADRQEYARLFDYKTVAPSDSEAIIKLVSEDRMDYLAASSLNDDVYTALQQRLAATTDTSERRTLAINMERCRWQMARPQKGERMVLVNLPAQQLWATCADSTVNMRICCGTVTTKTPLLHSQLSFLQVNPDWIIPQSIIKGEVAAHAGDSAYFARHRYYIVDRNSGDTLKATSVTQEQMRAGRVRVGQYGGPGNSLGRIVFRFPNDFAVYLHDTNNPSAFNRDRRTLSHGCVRVQKPFELAQFLMPNADEWTMDKLRISMGMKPQTEQGRQYLSDHTDDTPPHRLIKYRDIVPQIPVYIIYYTAYPNPETGEVELWPDIYGYDKVVGTALGNVMIK